MSREAGTYIYQRVDDVLRIFGSKIIISVRRQDALAASLYRLQAKNGHTIRFSRFLDLEQDQGTQRLQEFEYMKLVRYVEEKTGEPPLLLIFEDYLDDPEFYLGMLCTFLQCGVDEQRLDHKPVHKSYSDKQLRLRRQMSDRFLSQEEDWRRMREMTLESHNWTYTIKHRLVLWFTGIFMRLAKFAPDSWLNQEPLIETGALERVRMYYQDDWQACRQYVDQQAERLGVRPHTSKQSGGVV